MFIRRGQLYVPDYNPVFEFLAPAPFLTIPENYNHNRITLPIFPPMRPFMKQQIYESMGIKNAEFQRREIHLLRGHRLVVWECMEDGR